MFAWRLCANNFRTQINGPCLYIIPTDTGESCITFDGYNFMLPPTTAFIMSNIKIGVEYNIFKSLYNVAQASLRWLSPTKTKTHNCVGPPYCCLPFKALLYFSKLRCHNSSILNMKWCLCPGNLHLNYMLLLLNAGIQMVQKTCTVHHIYLLIYFCLCYV